MIYEQIVKDQQRALKKRERKKLSFLSYILSQIKNEQIRTKKPFSDKDVLALIKKHKKQLIQSIVIFKKGRREDLAESYLQQIDMLNDYLPPELTDEELQRGIEQIANNNKSAAEKNPRSLIGICMKKLGSKASPDRIIPLIKKTIKSYE